VILHRGPTPEEAEVRHEEGDHVVRAGLEARGHGRLAREQDIGQVDERESPRSSPMPARSVDPGIDEKREHEAVEGATHDHPGEERGDELRSAHQPATGLTTPAYPVGGTRSRCGSNQRAVMR
jgi:hypothetical protein